MSDTKLEYKDLACGMQVECYHRGQWYDAVVVGLAYNHIMRRCDTNVRVLIAAESGQHSFEVLFVNGEIPLCLRRRLTCCMQPSTDVAEELARARKRIADLERRVECLKSTERKMRAVLA